MPPAYTPTAICTADRAGAATDVRRAPPVGGLGGPRPRLAGEVAPLVATAPGAGPGEEVVGRPGMRGAVNAGCGAIRVAVVVQLEPEEAAEAAVAAPTAAMAAAWALRTTSPTAAVSPSPSPNASARVRASLRSRRSTRRQRLLPAHRRVSLVVVPGQQQEISGEQAAWASWARGRTAPR